MNTIEKLNLLKAYTAFLTAYCNFKIMMEVNFVEDLTIKDCEYLGLRFPVKEVNELNRTMEELYKLVKKMKEEDNS